jgi:hypothetical protein
MARRERPRDLDRPAGKPQLVDVKVIGEPDGPAGSHGSRPIGIVQASVTALLVAALLTIVLTTVLGGRHRGAAAQPVSVRPAPANSTPALPSPANSTPALPSPAEPTPPEPAQTHPRPASRAAARDSGPLGVAAAYGYPLRCLSITIAPGHRSYARADYNRVSACGRYDGTVTAIFHRVDGEWRPVLDATGYACPIASLSRAVAAELDVCP